MQIQYHSKWPKCPQRNRQTNVHAQKLKNTVKLQFTDKCIHMYLNDKGDISRFNFFITKTRNKLQLWYT